MPHHITLDHISYAHPGEPPLFTDLSAVFSAPLTGLIGDNGTGKTTLFRLILGEIKPSHGTISALPRIAHLPQDLGLSEHQHLADIFGITKILRALDALESGDYSPTFMTPLATPGILKNALLRPLPSTVLVLRAPRMPPTHTPFATF
ncbi:Uncharacterized ABC transporter ATP-binding protein YjjK [Rothia dentocariosa]|uniref:Uncharacterized ABC transporter ATP-binding protein YjjK n=1 Tax=Rothia dentocariosa TaxID=2047 RepID=A0A3S4YTN6_9MICC|nr:Uncharacterized ABC transporter ATP-binding protein YjjK [Rothia dentocariosa]